MFSIKAVELGKLKKLKIRHDNYGGGAAWFLDHIEVEDPKHRHTYVDLDSQNNRAISVPNFKKKKGSLLYYYF